MSGILIKTEIKLKYVHMFQVIEVSEKEWRYHLNFIMRHGPMEVRITFQLYLLINCILNLKTILIYFS